MCVKSSSEDASNLVVPPRQEAKVGNIFYRLVGESCHMMDSAIRKD